jgi:GT2 family glycosyltransferase
MTTARTPRLSVVIATYNRPVLLGRLLARLGEQTLPPGDFEVVVVDDGSRQPVAAVLSEQRHAYPLRLETQANAGAAAARHRGILAARAPLLVLVDDDMQLPHDFLERHLAAHPPGQRLAVLGAIRPPPDLDRMPIFERWHQRILEDFGARCRGGARPLGNNVYTGNLSLAREDYLAVGGFDQALGHSEDAELGLRLEQAGVRIEYLDEAYAVNGSDHASLAKWRRRAELYGIFDARIAAKHPGVAHASPWRFWPDLRRVSRPVLLGSALVPPLSRLLAGLVMLVVSGVAALGLENVAQAGTTLAYGIDYYRGVRLEAGSTRAFLAGRRAALAALQRAPGVAGP